MKTLFIFLMALMVLFVQPVAAMDGANQYLEGLAGDSGSTRSWDDLEEWIAGILIKFIELLQNISPLIILFSVFVGAGLLLLGSLIGSKSLRGAGGAGILAAVIAYLIVRNAPAILLMIQDITISR